MVGLDADRYYDESVLEIESNECESTEIWWLQVEGTQGAHFIDFSRSANYCEKSNKFEFAQSHDPSESEERGRCTMYVHGAQRSRRPPGPQDPVVQCKRSRD